jgi:DNA polymerase-3 subunit epsilon
MTTTLAGITDHVVAETPISIIDFETTGLTPGADRVVEVSVVRLEPGSPPRIAFDTLVNPSRRVAATEIHGITDDDVADAPIFEDVAGDLVRALADSVVAAYNVYFDIRFLEYELQRSGVTASPPHFCLMYMRPMLDLGNRCPLERALAEHGIDYATAHVASSDCLASASLMEQYLGAMASRGIETFADLARIRPYKFIRSFERDPLHASHAVQLGPCRHLKSRASRPPAEADPGTADRAHARRAYWDALTSVLADLMVTDDELAYLEQQRRRLQLEEEEIRVLHARAFVGAISKFVDDEWLDDEERTALSRLHGCLRRLGWAPGD